MYLYIENIGFYISKYHICESVLKMSHLPDLLTNTHIEEHRYKLQAFQTDSARSIYFSTKADWLYRWSRPFLRNTHSPTQQPAENLLKITFKIHQLKVASFFPYGKDSLHLFVELTWPNKSEQQAKIFATLSFCLM